MSLTETMQGCSKNLGELGNEPFEVGKNKELDDKRGGCFIFCHNERS